mmetsp:Transcript_3278/g.7663  ORF Transcript_3278/g.7663 Transcript_3278/m.7663 type:complete len:209 (+) Transcript_3278:2640-3266(+)
MDLSCTFSMYPLNRNFFDRFWMWPVSYSSRFLSPRASLIRRAAPGKLRLSSHKLATAKARSLSERTTRGSWRASVTALWSSFRAFSIMSSFRRWPDSQSKAPSSYMTRSLPLSVKDSQLEFCRAKSRRVQSLQSGLSSGQWLRFTWRYMYSSAFTTRSELGCSLLLCKRGNDRSEGADNDSVSLAGIVLLFGSIGEARWHAGCSAAVF